MELVLDGTETVTGRKARGLQTEEIGCKCQTFFLSLKQQEETNFKSQMFFPSLYEIKRWFPLKFCVAVTTPGSTRTKLFSNLELTNVFFLWKCFS